MTYTTYYTYYTILYTSSKLPFFATEYCFNLLSDKPSSFSTLLAAVFRFGGKALTFFTSFFGAFPLPFIGAGFVEQKSSC